jgi:putative DNA methylase
MTDFPRLIEHAFPLKQASLDSVHEKNVRHGHISTLHIWPARRPLAACRAALIATLLPDPGTPEGRKQLCERIGGRVVKRIEKKKMPGGQTVERVKEETEGGILHWLESEPEKSNKKKWKEWKARSEHFNSELEWFRQEIQKAYGGRVPKVLDPFSGGGAIPFEAMRLGCQATAVDINPVAWFILKCTLEYSQKLTGKTHPLPPFILHDDAFMSEFFKKAKGYSKAESAAALKRLHVSIQKKAKPGTSQVDTGLPFGPPDGADEEIQADLAWHVRAWGLWVLARARKELSEYYPTYADFEPIKKDHVSYERLPMRLLPHTVDGRSDIASFNQDFTQRYLEDPRNPRWVAKPTVAYLWARTVTCKNCRATVPLLKTRWLCRKKDGRKRVLLEMRPSDDRSGVTFGIERNVPIRGGNAAQRRENDKRVGSGTMSRSGTKCPCCPAIMTMDDIRVEGRAGRLGRQMTAVVVEGQNGKEYRMPTELELQQAEAAGAALNEHFKDVPFGVPNEPSPAGGGRGAGRAFSVQCYGIMYWRDLFTPRQLVALAALVKATREVRRASASHYGDRVWDEALASFLAAGVDRFVDFANVNVQWKIDADTINHALVRFAIQITWDFAEGNPLGTAAGAYLLCINRIATGIDTLMMLPTGLPSPEVRHGSAQSAIPAVDLVVTDPPYYDAIPYSDLMDWFYIWLRRSVHDLSDEHSKVMSEPLGPKWDSKTSDGELVDDESRHGGDVAKSKQAYEDGMAQAFRRCAEALSVNGRLVIVFANKSPDAWETLAAAVIRAGFIVDGSWPIQTEQPSRMRGLSSAALASSVWLVCRRRPEVARPGWDNRVLEEMRTNIAVQLREFWDAGIRGPDFVWAATGPAMEAYSKHPVVRKANEPNATMSVGEFLDHVRRMVVDYVVGQVLSGEKGADLSAADRLDDVTAYYLLHRHDFGMGEAPVGACILYATACGLSDAELERSWDILVGAGGDGIAEDSEDDDDSDDEDSEGEPDVSAEGGGSKVKLKAWSQRKSRSLGHEAPEGKAVPLIDRIHRLMHLWKDGDLPKVDDYIDEHGLRRNELFKRVVQSLIELSEGSERSLLESISNHIGAKGAVPDRGPELFTTKTTND